MVGNKVATTENLLSAVVYVITFVFQMEMCARIQTTFFHCSICARSGYSLLERSYSFGNEIRVSQKLFRNIFGLFLFTFYGQTGALNPFVQHMRNKVIQHTIFNSPSFCAILDVIIFAFLRGTGSLISITLYSCQRLIGTVICFM